MALNLSIMHAATMINMGECFTLTINGADVPNVEGSFHEPNGEVRLNDFEIDQRMPFMNVSTDDLSKLVDQPIEGQSTLTRKGGSAQTIIKVKPREGGRTWLLLRQY